MEAIVRLCNEAVERRIFPGCAVGMAVDGVEWCGAFGKHTYGENSCPVDEESVYDVASITKAVPVACLALMLVDEGKVRVDDRLIDTVPEFTGGYRELITMRHLFSHTLDFGFRLSACRECGGEEILKRVLTAELKSRPGAVFSYANATSILLGLVIERKTGMSLDAAAERMLFTPLGMKHTSFFPDRFPVDRVVPTEFDPWRGRMVQAEVHDESAYALRPKAVGSAGVFSTLPDLMLVLRMLLGGGVSGKKRFFKTATVRLMGTDICPKESGAVAGAGWELRRPAFMGKRCGPSTFGKTGFTGCSMVVDPEKKAGIILLSNHVHPRRHADRSVINEVRRELADIVFS